MKKMKTSWDLSLLYKSPTDPAIERDMAEYEKKHADFEKKYSKKKYTESPEALARALKDYENLIDVTTGEKAWWFFTLKNELNSNDTAAAAMATKFEQRIALALNKIAFFTLRIADIPKKDHARFLRNPALKPYRYTLSRIFELAKYKLTEKEEQLETLLAQTSYGMWVSGQEKVLTQQTVLHKGQEIPISKAVYLIADLPDAQRQILHTAINEKLKSVSLFAEAEINAIYNYKKMMDERRGYEKPYSATALSHGNDEKTIESLVTAVTQSFSISKKFYKIHAALLGKKQLSVADRSVLVGKINKKFDFESGVALVCDAFKKAHPSYAQLLTEFLEKGQIDVYPKKGKKGGGYSWNIGTVPTFVLLNHVDDLRSVEVLAHEMGHSIHSELSSFQPPLYRHYSTAVAEVASTFFEYVVSDYIESGLSEKEQVIYLHNKILNDIQTIFRQIAGFNFELELHQYIRKNGKASHEEMAALIAKHFQSYMGDVVTVKDIDGYSFVAWSHIRLFFYMYTYAYGQLVSRALYERWKADPSYIKKVDQFLRAGESMSPTDIFKNIGIDTTSPEFFKAGLQGIANDIKKLERLGKKYGMIK